MKTRLFLLTIIFFKYSLKKKSYVSNTKQFVVNVIKSLLVGKVVVLKLETLAGE